MNYIVASGTEPLTLEEAVAEAAGYGFRPYGNMAVTMDPRVLYQPMVKKGSVFDTTDTAPL
ncbi:hypothetical protein [Paraburkholderia caledonica]|uniref:hypothetical protein n=1 Tax=Paraburkholderia caledonica TaxID=134536 RepID=UPI001177570C|nr:hypothetical protein [Paraburkholderia caledonica]